MTSRRILIADSETVVARELEATLRRFGHDVVGIASSGREAMTLAAETEPHLILVDLLLAGDTTASATATELRRRSPVPVIFMTGETDATTLRRAGLTESSSYVVKPFAERELRMCIDLALCEEASARTSHELEERFFAVSIDMLCLLDFNGHFRRLNSAWERTLGYTREELMARPFIEFVHPDDRERTLAQNSHVRSGGQALGFENRYLCKDGSHRWFLWNAASDDNDQMIYSVARDVTARKEAEAERDLLVLQLQKALAEVRTLQAILPICSYCHKIRDDENYWLTVEGYVSRHTNSRFSHGICPSCLTTEVEPQFAALDS